MLYDVYRMFHAGAKLSVEKVRAVAPVTGTLRISTIRQRDREPMRIATLRGGPYDAGMLPALDDCVVAKFTEGGELLLVGTETIIKMPTYKNENVVYRQQWLCKPVDAGTQRA